MPDQLPDPIIKVVKESGNVKIHTFISPEAFLSNATHIIESENMLVIIDGQFIVPYAIQFRAYADSLGKPINRLYLSHGHPDHFFGIGAAFSDIAIYALPETISFLEQYGETIRASRAAVFGPFVAEKVVIPTHAVKAGIEYIDGVKYEMCVHADTETEFHLSFKLPELKVYIIQDLIYSHAHLYITKNSEHWIRSLKEVERSDYELFLPGHGTPADKAEVAKNIEYLNTAKKAMDDGLTNDAFKDFMLKAYPERQGAAIIDIYIPRLFGNESEI